ncbi:MAG: small multidrug export protein [Ruminococcaceae bacterium]|nr:small multidrug export protein [Oscillospiraceae bacterium]
MVPVIELRGALPVGVAAGLSVPAATIISIIGNMLPVPFILLLLRKVFAWLRSFPKLGGLIDRLEQRAHLKGQTVKKYRTLGLFILVAIPLPGTGAWTGALVASVLNMRMKSALPAIFFGVCVAGLIVALVTAGVIHLF